MSVRMRHTKGHSGNRRSHHALKGPRISRDTTTNSFHLRHRVDLKTGMYRGKKILEPTVRGSSTVETVSTSQKPNSKEPK
ncbi:MAG: 50S ribosomal protein L32 [Candidatus Paceibacterota bacterium]